ncbi:MAG TPA: hypothetical protein VK796_03925 [Cytophaga sp.]|nr:hypothetical protein [Cytophaga sp.]
MKYSIKVALRIFIYLSIAFTVVYWIYILIDDKVFIEKYWATNWFDYLGIWTLYFLAYFLGFSFYYWVIAFSIVFIYHKIIP